MISRARIAAYEVLLSVSRAQRDLPTAVALARASLDDDRDRALLAQIAIGVQRWRAALDHVIACFSRRSVDRLDPELVEILRLSAYQLLHLTRVPASAVVDDAVELARHARKKSAAGFVNAVLRAIARSRATLPLPPRPLEPGNRAQALDYLSITLSHPEWLALRWYERLGFETAERWMQFNNAPAPLTLRLNRLKLTHEELVRRLREEHVEVKPGRFAPDAFIVERGNPLQGRGMDEGWFVVQDEASQLVSLLVGVDPGGRLLDTCAAPGGKTVEFAAAMGNAGRLVACDIREGRMALLRRTVDACGAANVRLVQADLLHPLPFRVPFDCVVVDAPCSGLGTLRRDPDIRWRRQKEDLPRYAASELAMLRHAAASVIAGGRLVYATCSGEPEEDDGVVAAFLQSTPDFLQVDLRKNPGRLPLDVLDDRGFLRTLPHVHELECFFGAVFVRRR